MWGSMNSGSLAPFNLLDTQMLEKKLWLLYFAILLGPFHVNSQEVVKAPSPIFLRFYSNCHYPFMMNICKI